MTTASAPRLAALYLRLAGDTSLLEAYERDPRGTLADAGFAAAEIDAILESPDRARAALDAELSSDPHLRRLVRAPATATHSPDDDGGDDDEDGDDQQ